MSISYVRRPHYEKDGLIYIPLTKGYTAFCNVEALPLVEDQNWSAGGKPPHVYAIRAGGFGRLILLHRLIIDAPDDAIVDHLNGNTMDCRRCNLRLATDAGNARNAHIRTDNTSGFKGVTWHKHVKRWTAVYAIDGENIHIGYYDTAIDAACAYNEAVSKAYGEFAKLNDVGDRVAPPKHVQKTASGIRGVYPRTGRPGWWFASIVIDGRPTYLGDFEDKEKAAQAFLAALLVRESSAPQVLAAEPVVTVVKTETPVAVRKKLMRKV